MNDAQAFRDNLVRRQEYHGESAADALRDLIRGAQTYLAALDEGQHRPGGFDLARLGAKVEAQYEAYVEVTQLLHAFD